MPENTDNNNQENQNDVATSGRMPFLFIAGFVLVFVGVLLVIASLAFGGSDISASGGITIFIGPFPIVIGAAPDASGLMLIGLILAAITLVSFIMLRRRVG